THRVTLSAWGRSTSLACRSLRSILFEPYPHNCPAPSPAAIAEIPWASAKNLRPRWCNTQPSLSSHQAARRTCRGMAGRTSPRFPICSIDAGGTGSGLGEHKSNRLLAAAANVVQCRWIITVEKRGFGDGEIFARRVVMRLSVVTFMRPEGEPRGRSLHRI